MSLQIAIQQIQLPSFWGKQTPMQFATSSRTRDRTSDNDARRDEIMKILRVTGKPMDYATLSEQTGWSLFTLRNLINTLVDNGQVMRSLTTGRNAKAMVEAI